MKCIRCETDSKLKDRKDGKCPKCKTAFAFEPAGTAKDPVTDMLFKKAIDAVSSGGRVRWGVEHLYYEVCRRKRVHFKPVMLFVLVFATIWVTGFVGGLSSLVAKQFIPKDQIVWWFVFVGSLPTAWTLWYFWRQRWKPLPNLDRVKFGLLWDRWVEVHGQPPGLIVRQPPGPIVRLPATSQSPSPPAAFGRKPAGPDQLAPPARGSVPAPPSSVPAFGRRRSAPPPAGGGSVQTLTSRLGRLERDVGDYSFDRAVICDRARTVDLLVANNFHFENNCAVLSIDGYPEEPFGTVKAMLLRNPKLQAFVLHDATPDGCRLAHHLAYSPDWFKGKVRVTDLGLRPRHADPYRGLWRAAAGAVAIEPGIDAVEAGWLSRYELEVAALRPEFVLKRLYNGLSAHAKDDASSGGVGYCGSFDGGGSDGGGHGSAADGGADSFG